MITLQAAPPAAQESPSVVLPTTAASAYTAMADDTTSSLPASGTSRAAANESTQGALDALAALAAAETSISSHHPTQLTREITPHQTSDDDSEIMPPPPPRIPTALHPIPGGSPAAMAAASAAPSFTFLHDSNPIHSLSQTRAGGMGRMRSASNPEGMEKWDSYSRRNDRMHFVLPSSILEEELASTRRVLGEVVDEDSDYSSGGKASHGFGVQPQQEAQTGAVNGFQQHWNSTGVRRSKRAIARLGTSPDSVTDLTEEEPQATAAKPAPKNSTNGSTKSRKKAAPRDNIVSSQSPPPDEEEVDESALEPEELLRRARSRLLEDLSESGGGGVNGGANGEKGGSVLILPHSLSKYKEVYNKNGRIGIYTPAERAAIIQKFQAKRARRVWNKKIRYNCRKNLADRRLRVKGRFVKRSSTESSPPPAEEPKVEGREKKAAAKAKATARSSSPPTSGSPLTTVNEHEEKPDEEMPDVADEEAGFEPSEDMPYRRPRRYTIT